MEAWHRRPVGGRESFRRGRARRCHASITLAAPGPGRSRQGTPRQRRASACAPGAAILVVLALLVACAAPGSTGLHPGLRGVDASLSAAIRDAERVVRSEACRPLMLELLGPAEPSAVDPVDELLDRTTYYVWGLRQWSIETLTTVPPEELPAVLRHGVPLLAFSVRRDLEIHVDVGLAGFPLREAVVSILVHELVHLAGAGDARAITARCTGRPDTSQTP